MKWYWIILIVLGALLLLYIAFAVGVRGGFIIGETVAAPDVVSQLTQTK